MVRSCKESLDKVLNVLHTSIIWSHVFYIIAAFIAFYTKHYAIMIIAIVITIASIIHHLNTANKLWGHIDFITASSGALLILIYSIIVIWSQKIPIVGDKLRVSLIILYLFITVFAIITYVLAHFNTDGIVTDPVKGGAFGPVVTLPMSNMSNLNQTDSQECLDMSHQINYIYYHTLWHIFGGIAGIIIIIFIIK